MNNQPLSPPTREEVIEALKKAFRIVPPEEIKSPDAIYGYAYNQKIPEFREADQLYDAWKTAEEEKAKLENTTEAFDMFRFSDLTIFWDAGFNADLYYLDELAHDWLMQDEELVREQGNISLADLTQQKIDEIDKRYQELVASN